MESLTGTLTETLADTLSGPLAGPLGKIARQRTAPLILELDLTDGVIETRPTDPVCRGHDQAPAHDHRHAERRCSTRAGPTTGSRPSSSRSAAGRSGSASCRSCARRSSASARPASRPYAWAETFGEFSAGNVPYYLATRVRHDLPAAVGRRRPDRARRRAGLPARRAGQARRPMEVGAGTSTRARPSSSPSRVSPVRRARPPSGWRESVDRAAGRGRRRPRGHPATRPASWSTAARTCADQALATGLVDALGYRDEVYAAVRKQVGRRPDPAVPRPLPAVQGAGQPGQAADRAAPGRRRADPGDRRDPARAQRPQPD